MEVDKIVKVTFESLEKTTPWHHSRVYISTSGDLVRQEVIDIDIDFDGLLKLIRDIEKSGLGKSGLGLGKSLHQEAFTGLDYLGNKVKFYSYITWTDKIVYRYKFDKNWIPFNAEILRRNRDEKLNRIINES
jgi:hypothetical protein